MNATHHSARETLWLSIILAVVLVVVAVCVAAFGDVTIPIPTAAGAMPYWMQALILLATIAAPILLELIRRNSKQAATKVEEVRTDLAAQSGVMATKMATIDSRLETIHIAVNSERSKMQGDLAVMNETIRRLTEEAGRVAAAARAPPTISVVDPAVPLQVQVVAMPELPKS